MTPNKTQQPIEIRSEEVHDIISQVPNWLLRWGISLIFVLFLTLLAISWFVKYPDIIKAKIVVTTDPAPIIIVNRSPGIILLLKRENEWVTKNEVIATIQTNANLNDILSLERILQNHEVNQNYQNLNTSLKQSRPAGEMQSFLNTCIRSLQELTAFQKNHLHQKQIVHLQKQLKSNKKLNQNMVDQLILIQQETSIAHDQFKTDSLLFIQKVIAPIDFNRAKSSFLIQQRLLKNTEASIITSQLQMDALEKQMTELEVDKNAKEDQLTTSVISSVSELSTQIKKWKENYLVIAPEEGTVANLGFIENNQFIEGGKSLFALLPNSKKMIAKAELPIAGAGKVKSGQEVNIKLYDYPYEQFGMLRGTVLNVSQV